MMHSPDVCNSQEQIRPKLGSRNKSGLLNGNKEPQVLGVFPALSQGNYREARSKKQQAQHNQALQNGM